MTGDALVWWLLPLGFVIAWRLVFVWAAARKQARKT